ncbi:hypothetical protein D1227_01335 [Henriciella mobilis]|nr:hypothetical protein D1227_01335 [Henriciella mobilis]
MVCFLIASKYLPLLDSPIPDHGQAESQQANQKATPKDERPADTFTALEGSRAKYGPSNTEKNSDTQSNDHLFLGDGWAQWAMVGVSLAALIVSVWAVYLLQRTLKATRQTITKADDANRAAQDAVAVTREIGQAQIRPYLTYELGELVTTEGNSKLELVLTVENCGQSPARFFCAKKVAVLVASLGETVEHFWHTSAADHHWVLMPGLKAGGEKLISINLRLQPKEVAKIAEWKRSGKNFMVNVSGIFTWKTPFGEDSQPFTFNQVGKGSKGNFIYDMITVDHVESMWRASANNYGINRDSQRND